MAEGGALKRASGIASAGAWLATFLLGPLLPRPLRILWPFPERLEAPGLQVGHASLHALSSVVVWMACLVRYLIGFSDRSAADFVQAQGTSVVDEGFLRNFGILGFFAFLFTPVGMLCGLYLFDSLLRFVDSVMHRSVPGSLFVAVPAFLLKKTAARLREAALVRRYGPADAPDRAEVRGESLFVRTSRPRADWHDLLTFSYGGKLYRLAWRGEVPDGVRRCHEHRLEPWPAGIPVRRIVLLDGEGVSGAR